MLKDKLKTLFAGQRLSRFGDGGAKGVTSRSTMESHQWSRSERWGRRPTGRGRPDSWDVNISFLLGQPQSSGNAKEKSLDVTLDDPAVQCTQMDPAGWSDVNAWFIRAVNSVLGRSQFEEQIVRMIPKTENTSEHKNQSDAINDMTSDTIRTNPGVVTVTSPITPTQRSGIGAPTLGVWNRGLRLQRSEGWHQLEPTQEVDVGR